MATKRTYPVRVQDLEAARLSQGLSIEKLAIKAGVNVKTLKRMLDGRKSYLPTIAAVAKALGMTSDRLRADIEDKEHPPHTDFSLNITIAGQATTPEQIHALVTMTPSIQRLMDTLGLKMFSLQSNLTVEQHIQDTARVFIVIYNIPCELPGFQNFLWLFMSVRNHKYEKFINAYNETSLGFSRFDAYGEVIFGGQGFEPPDKLIDALCVIFNTADPAYLDGGMQRHLINYFDDDVFSTPIPRQFLDFSPLEDFLREREKLARVDPHYDPDLPL
jgi:lambda repressor-like predicted transcriptional regulator